MASTFQTLPSLWLVRLDARLPPGAATWLDEDERSRLARTGHPVARHARTVAWSLRRWALSQARPDVEPARWCFISGSNGKPELAPRFAAFGLHHNLSHGGAYAAVLVADAPCGVDVEASQPGIEAAADVVLSKQEWAAVRNHLRPADRFLQHWVMKEAALKLLGTGFSETSSGLDLALALDGASATEIARPSEGPRLPPAVQLQGWPLPDGHRLAAALSRPAMLQPTYAIWDDADVASNL